MLSKIKTKRPLSDAERMHCERQYLAQQAWKIAHATPKQVVQTKATDLSEDLSLWQRFVLVWWQPPVASIKSVASQEFLFGQVHCTKMTSGEWHIRQDLPRSHK